MADGLEGRLVLNATDEASLAEAMNTNITDTDNTIGVLNDITLTQPLPAITNAVTIVGGTGCGGASAGNYYSSQYVTGNTP
jgi:hypothetical protein